MLKNTNYEFSMFYLKIIKWYKKLLRHFNITNSVNNIAVYNSSMLHCNILHIYIKSEQDTETYRVQNNTLLIVFKCN